MPCPQRKGTMQESLIDFDGEVCLLHGCGLFYDMRSGFTLCPVCEEAYEALNKELTKESTKESDGTDSV